MNLNPADCERFYRIWFRLLRHVNLQEQIIPELPEDPKAGSINPQDAGKLRAVLWSSDKWLASFKEEQKDRLSEQDLTLVGSWKWRVSGKFYIMRHLKSYSVFLGTESSRGSPVAYGVLGIVSPIDEIIIWPPPVLVEAILLPFEGKIIYDSLLSPYSITFGSGIRNSLNNDYRTVRERGQIITSLDQGGVAEDPKSVAAGNIKILLAFQKDLAASGLSAKMVNQHGKVIEAFIAYLAEQDNMRSLLDVHDGDVDDYWKNRREYFNHVSFKRFVRFMLNTNRMDWDVGQDIQEFLKGL
ncbi:conserved hypothetical protein [Gammaproteobacteria bacterium]